MCDGGIEIGGDHGANTALAKAPGGAGIGLADLLEHAEECRRRRFGAADAFRQQQLVEAAFGQRRDHFRREAPVALDGIGFRGDERRQRAGAPNEIRLGGIRGADGAHYAACCSQAAASSFSFVSAGVPPMMTGAEGRPIFFCRSFI